MTFHLKLVVWAALGAASIMSLSYRDAGVTESRRDAYFAQMDDRDDVPAAIRRDYAFRGGVYAGVGVLWAALGGLMFSGEIRESYTKMRDEIG